MNIGDSWNGWTVEEILGKGTFGNVYRITRSEFNYTYESALNVIKIPNNEAEYANLLDSGMSKKTATTYFRSMVEELVSEVALMSQLKGSSYIVSYEDHQVVELQDPSSWEIYIRMELLKPFL